MKLNHNFTIFDGEGKLQDADSKEEALNIAQDFEDECSKYKVPCNVRIRDNETNKYYNTTNFNIIYWRSNKNENNKK